MKKNIKIEQWMDENRKSFDDLELPLNHRLDFESKLDNYLGSSKKTNFRLVIFKYAAAIVIAISVLGSSYYFSQSNFASDNQQLASNTSFEDQEEEYSIKIKEALVPVRSSNKYLSPEYRSFLKQIEILDLENDKLKEMLDVNPEDEILMQSILDNYKKRLDILEKLKLYISNKNLNK